MSRISKQEIRPVVYKGNWNGNQMSGEGFIKFSNDLIISAEFNNNKLRDSKIQILYPNGDIYCGKHKGGIKNGEGNYLYKSNGVKYIGDWKEDKKQGKGEMVYPLVKGQGETNARLIGAFDDDELQSGQYMDALGNTFKSMKYNTKDVARIQDFIDSKFVHQHTHFEHGHFVKGRLIGWGEVEYKGGDCYRGMFKDGKRSGYGVMSINQYNDVISQYVPARFEGEWKFNKRNGYGEMEWPDKSKFSGLWSNDCRVQGKLEMPDDNVYDGHFQHDLMHGLGKITYVRDNLEYEGLFHKGQASNIGRLTNQDHQVYIGEIENLKRQGLGILIDKATNLRYEGEFEDDIPTGLGKLTYPNGDIYIGMVEKACKQGRGRLESNGEIFEGEFSKDQKDGVGYYFQGDGKVYCGQFRQDKEEGIGEYLREKDIENNFKSIDKVKFKILTDKLYKICR
jgi:hypothetical protein